MCSVSTPTQLRPFGPADAATVAHLHMAACRGQWAVTAPELLKQSGTRWVAAVGDQVIASARLSPFGPGAEDAQRLSLCGDAAHFSRLALAALSAADRQGAARVLGVVREDWEEQVRFFQTAGFANVWQSFGAHLPLHTFRAERFDKQLKRLYLQGYEVREWAPREGAGEELRELYVLRRELEQDAPATPATRAERLSQGEFAAALQERRTWVLWQSQKAVAYTSFHFPHGQPDNAGTVTRRDRRGQGLALALKAHALEELRQAGFTQASTGGAAANLAMLRVNLRLGHQLEPLWLTFEQRL